MDRAFMIFWLAAGSVSIAGCTTDATTAIAGRSPNDISRASNTTLAEQLRVLSNSIVGSERLGCLAIQRRGLAVEVAPVSAGEVGLSARKGVLHIVDLALDGGVRAQCFVKRGEDVRSIRAALGKLGSLRARWSAFRPTSVRARNASESQSTSIALEWLTGEIQAALAKAGQRPMKTDVSLSISGGPCPTTTIYIVNSCVAIITATVGPSYIIMGFDDIFRKLSEAPTSLSVFFPTDEEILQAAMCASANEMSQEMDNKSQRSRIESDQMASSFLESGGYANLCERVLSGPNEMCIDLFISEALLGFFLNPVIEGFGDSRDFDANARRNKSRAQINFDPETLELNAFINTSDVIFMLPASGTPTGATPWVKSFGPDGGVVWTNTSPEQELPATAKKLRFGRINGDSNTAYLTYDFANNVCRAAQACPTISGDWTFIRGQDGKWRTDVNRSKTDTYPHHAIYRLNSATGSFIPVIEVEAAGGLNQGLNDMQTLSDQIRAQQQKIFPGSGCNPY